MQPATNSPSSSIRVLRIFWLAMLGSVVLLVFVSEIVAHSPQQEPQAVLFAAITGVAISVLIVVATVRRKFMTDGARLLAKDPGSSEGLGRWYTGHILGYASNEAICLFGLVLRFLGFTLREVAPFYVAALILMLLSPPKAPPENAGL